MIVSILAGLAIGLAVAAINTVVMRGAIKKGSAASMMIAVTTRMLLDVGALAAVYLLRDKLPLQFQPAMIATAVGLTAGIISLAVLTSKQNKTDGSDKSGGE